ncbi:MAG: hypothetical protein IPK75_00865 [Acidobacteria bacterium]|jgi:hypothetical protein|nr:hypothetical protein [Acidobacteriota bacterium]
MNTLPASRTETPASSPVLDRIFTVAAPRAAGNDTNYARTALIVRRRERQNRLNAR